MENNVHRPVPYGNLHQSLFNLLVGGQISLKMEGGGAGQGGGQEGQQQGLPGDLGRQVRDGLDILDRLLLMQAAARQFQNGLQNLRIQRPRVLVPFSELTQVAVVVGRTNVPAFLPLKNTQLLVPGLLGYTWNDLFLTTVNLQIPPERQMNIRVANIGTGQYITRFTDTILSHVNQYRRVGLGKLKVQVMEFSGIQIRQEVMVQEFQRRDGGGGGAQERRNVDANHNNAGMGNPLNEDRAGGVNPADPRRNEGQQGQQDEVLRPSDSSRDLPDADNEWEVILRGAGSQPLDLSVPKGAVVHRH